MVRRKTYSFFRGCWSLRSCRDEITEWVNHISVGVKAVGDEVVPYVNSDGGRVSLAHHSGLLRLGCSSPRLNSEGSNRKRVDPILFGECMR